MEGIVVEPLKFIDCSSFSRGGVVFQSDEESYSLDIRTIFVLVILFISIASRVGFAMGVGEESSKNGSVSGPAMLPESQRLS